MTEVTLRLARPDDGAAFAAIYGPGTNIPVAASEVLHLIAKKRMAGFKRAKLA